MSDLGKDVTRIRKVCVKDYNLKELADIYNVSRWRLRMKMKRYKDQIGKPKAGYSYEPDQVGLIFQLIPLPLNVRVVRI